MGDVMQGIEEDVPFDHGVCDGLESACRAAATAIDGQRASRASYVTTAMQEFRGRFSELFTANADVAKADASELATRLRDVAAKAAHLQECARAEQQRRETARAWKQEQDDRNGFERFGDWLTGGEEPPVGPPDPEPSESVDQPTPGPRQTPAPGTGGGGGGGGATTSAKPEDLRSFATGSSGLDSSLSWRPGALKGRLDDFAAQCRWGTLDASGVMTGFDSWLDANDNDVQWATTVANAFAAAGGEGAVSTLSDSALASALQAAGVDATRDDIVIDPAIAVGNPPTTGYANDPVNTSTGNFVENEVDLGFTGGAASLGWRRSYSSFDDHVGAFGPGWSSACDVRLDLDDEGATLVLEDGRHVAFPRSGDGWARATGENRWLAREHRDGDHGRRELLVATDNAGGRSEFTTSGTWLSTSRGAGTRVEASYDERGRLVGLAHERGRSVELRWDGVGDGARVVEAGASDGRRVVYGYDDAGRLTSARGPLGTRTYRWDEAGLVDRVVDADGVVEAENTYDEQRRVVTQRSQFGRLTRFAYLPGRLTVTSDEDGTRSNTWVCDGRGRVVGIVDAEDHRQSMAYDRHGNLVSSTERDGSVTVHTYDGRGRRTRTVTPSGADLTYGHDEHDRVTTVVTEAGAVTTYEYAGPSDRNPSVMVDPEGGRTELAWRDGLLAGVTDPTGVTVTFDHDEHGDLVATSDALGHTARLERDESGRVVAAVTPGGSRTMFTYDGAGLLLSRRDPDGAEWTYEHSTAGRPTAVVDPLGARTEMERGEHGETVSTTDPLGRTVSRELDDLGNLAATRLPDGTTWTFAHDALSRLTESVDPTGATWRREYDANGALSAVVGPDDARRTVTTDVVAGRVNVDDGESVSGARFDALGRPVATERPDGTAALTTYDRCGRPVELVDGEGGLTRLQRDAAGRVVARTTPSGAAWTWEHDAAGRLAATVDPAGGRTSYERDADGRVVRVVLPTGEVATTEYDACGRVTARRVPGRGTSRFRRDACGRVVSVRDSWSGHRRFRYDAAGQLVEVVNGVGGVTRYEYDANGRAVRIVDPLGGVTTREFDARNRCVAETDPLGRTTRAAYDVAGRISWQADPTGARLSWTYDAAGRVASTSVDGQVVSRVERDLRARTVTVHDRTGEREVVHGYAWDRRGLLLSRTRDGQGLVWTYDADGRRTSLTTPDGHRTDYGHDAAGRVVTVDHPLLGRAVLERDASGRVTQAAAGGVLTTLERRDGWVVATTVTDADGSTRTELERDADGRIEAVDRDGTLTAYEHDDACRLVSASTGETVQRWAYDSAGRLVAETRDGAVDEYSYDSAGQLVSVVGAAGTTAHTYDGAGRRVRTERSDGSARALGWTPLGWLSSVTETARGGASATHDVHVDATGELADMDGTEVWLDSASGYAPAPVQLGDRSVVGAGPLTGLGDDWSARARGAGDPWAPVGLLQVGGLELMGKRAYDPATRGFLSTDPLDPVVGAGWSGNPYSFAGDDPLHAVDPTGLRPVTEEELQAYIDANQGALAAAGDWVSDNWEYLAGGAMVIAGGVLVATGVGGPAGMMLISAGADTIIQKATTGEVNWGQVAISGAFGAWGGVGAAARMGVTSAAGRTIVGGMISGGTSGAVSSGYGYMTGPGPHTPGGFLQATTTGAAVSTVTGGAASAFSHAASGTASRLLDDATPGPFMPANDGGLPDDLAATFSGNRYTSHVLTEDTVLHRAGTEGRPLGQFFSSEPPVGVTQTRIDKAIPEVWPDGTPAPLDTGYSVSFPAGTTVYTGEVANQGGLYMGGTEQIVVREPWNIDGHQVVDSWGLN